VASCCAGVDEWSVISSSGSGSVMANGSAAAAPSSFSSLALLSKGRGRGGDASGGGETRPRRDDEARPAGVTRTRPRGGGTPVGEDEHEGPAARR
jgi:hypothetical protein